MSSESLRQAQQHASELKDYAELMDCELSHQENGPDLTDAKSFLLAAEYELKVLRAALDATLEEDA